MTSEPSKQISSEILIIHEEVDNTDNCNQENPSLMGLNSPSFLEQNSSQATERSSKIPTVKTTENGNYLRQNLAVDAEDTDVSRTLPRQAERVSFSSINRDSPYTPFPGFQIPNETIIPLETDSPQGKRKKGICAQEAIPVLPRSVAIMCLVLNIAIPGLGTAISGLVAFFMTRHDVSLVNRTTMLCVNCFVAVMQLFTVVFLLIGWFWSITWGCAFVGLSEQYVKHKRRVQDGGSIA